MDHIGYMRKALALAEKGCGFVNPNPMVGAVIVKDDQIIGTGYHEQFGGPHAERNAIASCTGSTSGATLYVTLEPCCHYGKTPPCTEAIIENKIGTVVIGSKDPNPLVAGKGIELLKKQGIRIINGVLEEECIALNEVFFHYIKNKMPFIAMKYGMTLDGKIATCTGESKWITSEQSREHAHRLRHRYSAIMVGINTVIADDPMLNCRLDNCKNPVRIVCDTNLRIPLSSKIVQTARELPTIIACSCDDSAKEEKLTTMGCQIWKVSKHGKHIDLKYLMTRLCESGIDSVLLEGGAELNFSALDSRIVQKIYAYIAPKILGGVTAKTPVGGPGIKRLENAIKLKNRHMSILGTDVLLEYLVEE